MVLPTSAWILKNCQGKSAWPVSFDPILDAEEYVRKADIAHVDTSSFEKEIKKLKEENRKLKAENEDLYNQLTMNEDEETQTLDE
jgi:regulator of replication initiation timing